jgi:hypothetical protein
MRPRLTSVNLPSLTTQYHPSFPQPSDPSVLVWRYMDFSKLVSLLSKQELYLRRLDLLPDKFEGLYPRRVRKSLAEYYATQGLTADRALELANHRVDFSKESRQMMYASCWRLDNFESEAMWRIYCGGDNGLAVVLPYKDLRTSITTGIAWIGAVRYLDFWLDLLAPGKTFVVALHKRREFTYEQEARILSFGNASFSKPEDRPHFISLPWQINVIKKIVVSPYASASYFEEVRDEVKRLSAGLGQRVVRSVMVADPD